MPKFHRHKIVSIESDAETEGSCEESPRPKKKKKEKNEKGRSAKNTRKEREREKKEINERKNADDRLEVIKRRSSVIKRMNLKKRGAWLEGGFMHASGAQLHLAPLFKHEGFAHS